MFPIDAETLAAIKTFVAIMASMGIVVEVTPFININPISFLLGKLGDALNRNQEYEIKKLEQQVKELRKQMTEHDIDQLRWNILDFANSCRQGRRHTKDEFEHVIKAHTQYVKILEDNGMQNGQVDTDYKYIENIYYKCMQDNDFI